MSVQLLETSLVKLSLTNIGLQTLHSEKVTREIDRALIHVAASDGLNTTLNLSAIVGILLSMDGSEGANFLIESTFSIPTPDELEHILKDPKANPEGCIHLINIINFVKLQSPYNLTG